MTSTENINTKRMSSTKSTSPEKPCSYLRGQSNIIIHFVEPGILCLLGINVKYGYSRSRQEVFHKEQGGSQFFTPKMSMPCMAMIMSYVASTMVLHTIAHQMHFCADTAIAN